MRPRPLGGRLLGGSDSWRRIVVTGVVGGATVALAAALLVALIDGRGGVLDGPGPTAQPPAGGPVGDGRGDVLAATQEPQAATPAVQPTVPAEPTATATLPTEPPPTELLPEPTATPSIEEPTPEPTAPEGGPQP